jgi:L-ornithine N5-acetyltransferase
MINPVIVIMAAGPLRKKLEYSINMSNYKDQSAHPRQILLFNCTFVTMSPSSLSVTVWAELRHAELNDVSFLRRMIHQMAEFEGNPQYCSATDSSLLSTLFPSHPLPLPPFFYPTPLFLYLSFDPLPPHPSQTFTSTMFSLSSPVIDHEEDRFASPLGDGRVIAGFLFCFPNYSTPLVKPGLYIEDIFVREPWRRKSLGKFMLSAVAKKAAQMGMDKG